MNRDKARGMRDDYTDRVEIVTKMSTLRNTYTDVRKF